VNSSTEASGSKPRSNTKNNKNLPAKSVNQKTIKDHPMTNKSVWTKVNRVDSSISSKCRTGRPLVSGLRLFKTYDGESFKAQELCGKVHRDSQIRE
ncbi:hypothetical protein Tco_0125923, partial [Tanacetum coccineum]